MTAAINCLATCTFTATSTATNSVLVATTNGSPTAGAMVIAYDAYSVIVSGSPTNIELPATTVYAVQVRNTGNTNALNVTCTPAGGSAFATPMLLIPGGVFTYWLPYSSTPGSGGITALTLQGSGGATTAEILLAS